MINKNNNLILNFIYKFLFIIKAISDGYIVKYIGGNKFDFIKLTTTKINKNQIKQLDENEFIKSCSSFIPEFIIGL
jgi:hypothetical protein